MNLDFLSDMLFPLTCLGCSQKLLRGVLCPRCQDGIALFNTLFCGICNARLPELRKVCHKDAPYILGAATQYDDVVVQRLVHGLKFHGVTSVAQYLANILIAYIEGLGLDLQRFIVTPIPLSIKRQRARGFNQSALIANLFAKRFSLTLEEHIVTRILHKKPQSETTDILERQHNIQGCFFIPNPERALGKNIILIDDVTTSGTTFREAAGVLKVAGAKRIIALAVARA